MYNPLYPLRRPFPFADICAEHVRPAVEAAIQAVRENIQRIVNRQYEDLLTAMDDLTVPLDEVMTVVGHLESVATTDNLREAYADVQGEVSELYSSIGMNPDLWSILKNHRDSRPETGVRARLLKQLVDAFIHGGAELSDDKKKRLSEIEVELSELCLKFSQNSLDSSNAFELHISEIHKKRLKGIPEAFLESMADDAAEHGRAGFRISLKAPCYDAVIRYADDRELRREIYTANCLKGTNGSWDNRPLISEILKLRLEKARMMGYANFADYVLLDRMAKNGATAREAMDGLRDLSVSGFERDKTELQKFCDRIEGDNSKPIEMWDVAYYAEKMKKAVLSFDAERLREYFPFEAVLSGAFGLAENLYGIQIRPWADLQIWDSSVLTYQIYDVNGELLGGIYIDPYVRATKSEGAWCNGLVNGIGEPAAAAIVLNNAPPTDGKPSLLNHLEVETVFHEFGHCLHHMLSKTKFRSHFGMEVAWDFVELPSQVMENWTWDWDCLQTFAKHWQTGELLPRDLFDQMIATRKFRGASAMMTQLGYSNVDLMLHMEYDPNSGNGVLDVAKEFMQPYYPAKLSDLGQRIPSFTHIFGDPTGYAAGYYSYKWAEILDADAFAKFKEIGHMGREAGQRFRDAILSRGDEEDPSVLYREFKGCDPTAQALLENYGLR